MIVECTGCRRKYKIPDERIPALGVEVRCPKCKVIFAVKRESERKTETLAEQLFGKEGVERPLGEGTVQAGKGEDVESAEADRPTADAGQRAEGSSSWIERMRRRDLKSQESPVESTEQVEPSVSREATDETPESAPGEEEEQEDTWIGREGEVESGGDREEPSRTPEIPEAEAKDTEDFDDIERDRTPWSEEAPESEGTTDTEEICIPEEPVEPQVQEKQEQPETEWAEAPSAAQDTGAAAPGFPFGADEQDPRTLARALVSDILFYNRKKRDEALAEDKILSCLGKEIARSWEIYKERVGIEKVTETDHFREAVNEILADGKRIL